MFSAVQAYLNHPLRGVLKPELDEADETRTPDSENQATKAMKVNWVGRMLVD